MSDPSDVAPSIEIRPNGPYIITGAVRIENAAGEPKPEKPRVALCRCGDTKNSPFCDASHKTNGFDGGDPSRAGVGQDRDYVGQRITIHDNRRRCAHAGACVSRFGSIFDRHARPWINPEGDTAERVMEAARACPSGALAYTIDGVRDRDWPEESPRIRILKDGPAHVMGRIPLDGIAWPKGETPNRYTLCRCGASKNKPFCDGSHAAVGFRDAG